MVSHHPEISTTDNVFATSPAKLSPILYVVGGLHSLKYSVFNLSPICASDRPISLFSSVLFGLPFWFCILSFSFENVDFSVDNFSQNMPVSFSTLVKKQILRKERIFDDVELDLPLFQKFPSLRSIKWKTALN